MRPLIIIVMIFATFFSPATGQTKFVVKGKIEFERKTNIHRLFYTEEESSSWDETMRKLIPQFKIDYFDLVFTEDKTLYKPGRENPDSRKVFFEPPAQSNIIFKDLVQQTGVAQKQVYESNFLVIDSLRNVEWKLQPEIRTIAGFECRKAVGRICDSVVVVAFYTDEIVPASGPESFQGLPGMILGLAIPRLYTTWFATKVELLPEGEENRIVAPTRGKKANSVELVSKVNEGIKDWGEKYREKALWLTAL